MSRWTWICRALRLALVLAIFAAASALHAAPPVPSEAPSNATAATANETSENSKSKKSWRRVPDWMRRNLDPRRAFRRDDKAAPAKQEPQAAATRKPAPRPRAAVRRKPRATAVAPAPAPPIAAPLPELPAPPPEPVAAPVAASALVRVAGAVLGLAALLALWGASRRRPHAAAPEPIAAPSLPLLAAPVTEAQERTIATQRQATIDVVALAIAHSDATARAFPADGRYEIVAEIGRGGMGVVYEARDKRLDRIVALKRLPDTLESDEQAVALLLREARSAARLNHRNIVTVHDVDRDNGAWFITMELLEGELLSSILKAQRRLSPRSAVWIGEQVASGLGYAHECGIVHRDVKPSNLFVTRDQTVKLMDFGVAKILEEARRSKTMVGGTPSYMAPEQAAGDAVDGRTDLYALGATLFEMLTGEVPFAKGDPTYHHQLTQPPDPRERAAGIPDALAELVLTLLRKHPDERPVSAGAVAARLREIAASTVPNSTS